MRCLAPQPSRATNARLFLRGMLGSGVTLSESTSLDWAGSPHVVRFWNLLSTQDSSNIRPYRAYRKVTLPSATLKERDSTWTALLL